MMTSILRVTRGQLRPTSTPALEKAYAASFSTRPMPAQGEVVTFVRLNNLTDNPGAVKKVSTERGILLVLVLCSAIDHTPFSIIHIAWTDD